MLDNIGCAVCDGTDEPCCRNSYDEVTGVDAIRSYLRQHIFRGETEHFSADRVRCFQSNIAYTLQYLEFLTCSNFDHLSQRHHASVYTVMIKQYCVSVFSVIEAYLAFDWLKRDRRPPAATSMLNQSRDKNLLSNALMDELNWLADLRHKLHLPKILSDRVRGNDAGRPYQEYDWNSFRREEYLRAKELLKNFLMEVSEHGEDNPDFQCAFNYL